MGTDQGVRRSELYRLLWTEPTTHVARTYGLSDVGLAKICKKYDIPRPPRGYWAQLQHGHKPKKTALPRADEDPVINLRGTSVCREPDVETAVTAPAAKVEPVEIRVADTLRGCHELVTRANQELQGAETDSDDLLISQAGRSLDVRTTKTSLRRALLILDALLKECVRRDYGVSAGPSIVIGGQSLGISIHELVDSKREPDDELDLAGHYEFRHNRFKTVRSATGRLVLSITHGRPYASGSRCTWRDTDKRRLEDQLGKAFHGLIETAELARQERERERRREEERRQEELRRQEAARQLAERKKQYKAEKARFQELLEQARNLQKSRQIRDLIEAVRQQQSANGPIPADSEAARWIEWATLHADRLDPLRPSPPSILDEQLEEEPPSFGAYHTYQYERPKTYWEQRNWWNRNR